MQYYAGPVIGGPHDGEKYCWGSTRWEIFECHCVRMDPQEHDAPSGARHIGTYIFSDGEWHWRPNKTVDTPATPRGT
jgi:hypothetical protein